MADDVHYRLYAHPERGLIVVCVQWFDYADYDETRFVGRGFSSEAEADMARLNLGLLLDGYGLCLSFPEPSSVEPSQEQLS